VEPECSFPCLQELAPDPYPEPYAYSPHLPTLFPEDPFQYYAPIYTWVFTCMLYTRPTSYSSIWSSSVGHSPWEVNNPSASQIPRLLWIPKVLTVFTRAHHWSLPLARCIQSTYSHPISVRLFWYFPPIYACVFRVVSSLQVFQLKYCMHFSSVPCVLHVPPTSSSLIWYLNPNNIWWSVQVMENSSLFSLMHPSTVSSFLNLKIILNTLFSNTLNLCSSHGVRGHVSHAYDTTDKI